MLLNSDHSGGNKPKSCFLVEPVDIFNLSLFEYRFVVDCRASDSFSTSRIVSAFSYAGNCDQNTSAEARLHHLFDLLRSVIEHGTPEHLSPV